MKPLLSAVAVVLVVVGCGPNPPVPVRVMAVAPTETGLYSTREVQLQTITSITAMKGSVAQFIGGGRIVLDSTDPLQNLAGGLANQTANQRYQAVVKDQGLDVRGNFIERGGVLWPADFDTWNMVSTYYNFEQSYTYYADLAGIELPEIQNQRVFYAPEVHFNDPNALTDNALYLSFIDSFVLVPQRNDQLVPLSMNLGVIGHEVAHKIFNHRVMADQGIHPALLTWNLVPFNLLKSIDEGFADFHGYGATVESIGGPQPDFLRHSISNAAAVTARDLSRNQACMTASLRNALKNFSPTQWVSSPELYEVGTIFAASFYQVGNRISGVPTIITLENALLKSYNDPSATTPGLSQLLNQNVNNPAAFTPEAVANIIASHIGNQVNDPLRVAWCTEITNRMQLSCIQFPCDEMPACGGAAKRDGDCKVVVPQ